MNTLKTVQIQDITASDLIDAITQNVIRNISKPEPQPTAEKLLTRKQVAGYLDVSLVTIYNWTKKGILNPYRIGNQVRYKESDVLDALQSINQNKAE